jgi:hypothetical protein
VTILNTKTSLLVVACCVGLSVGCGAEGADRGSEPAAPSPEALATYEQEVRVLKATPDVDYDAALQELQQRYGIVVQQPIGVLDLPIKEPEQLAAPGLKAQAGSSGVEVVQRSYAVQRTYQETKFFKAGDSVSASTTGASSGGADPILVLFQYADPTFQQYGYIPASSNPKLSIVKYDDDGAGNRNSSFSLKVPSSGYYVLMALPYSPSSVGNVELNVTHCPVKGPPICSGNVCTDPPPQPCTASQTPIALAGHPMRGYDFWNINIDFMATDTLTGGADTWLFAFNFDSGDGSANDDYNGSYSSRIDRSDFQFRPVGLNTVLLSGYNSQGSATYRGYTH